MFWPILSKRMVAAILLLLDVASSNCGKVIPYTGPATPFIASILFRTLLRANSTCGPLLIEDLRELPDT